VYFVPSTTLENLRPRAIVVDDEITTRELLRLHLSLAGFEIEEAGDGRQALERLRTDPFELIILDVVLPSLDGVTLCRAIRSDGPNKDAGVLMVTARVTEADKVVGLDSGADDYLTKPFGVRELIARIGAIMRRCRRPAPHTAEPHPTVVVSRDITLDVDKREATVRGTRIELTKQEFDLLYRIAARPGIVYSRTSLLQNVWSDDTHVTERTVDSVISRLRRKVEIDPHHPRLILTAWGIGYKFADVEM
jgi:DNA-binding response OmpR family regulator